MAIHDTFRDKSSALLQHAFDWITTTTTNPATTTTTTAIIIIIVIIIIIIIIIHSYIQLNMLIHSTYFLFLSLFQIARNRSQTDFVPFARLGQWAYLSSYFTAMHMNKYLTTLQHENYFGYWKSNKCICVKLIIKS